MAAFGRVVTAMVTPFTDDGGMDLDGAQELASWLVDHGSDTILVHGTTGESPTLHGDEIWSLQRAVQQAVAGRAKVLVGTGSNDTSKAIDNTRHATENGADGVLVVTPYYNKPSQRALVRYFTDVADATDLPVVMYDIPGRTSREIELDTIVRLAHDVDNIVAVKDAVGNLAKTAEVVARTPDDFEVYCGADEVNLPMLSVGAVGFVSVASHLAGPELADMAAVYDTDPTKAREIHLRLMPLYHALFVEPSPGPLKGALNRLGLPAGPLRPPLVDALDETVTAVLDAMDHAGLSRP